MDEKAVSEAIGFLLILGIVLTGISLVTLYGYPALVKEQSSTDAKKMEQAMVVIQSDMKSLCYRNVPYKESTLHVSGGTLEVIGAGDHRGLITVSNGTWSQDYPLGALTYRSDRSAGVITLENGAVMIRQEGVEGSVMLTEPRWFYDGPTGTFVIHVMKISAYERMTRSGMTTVRMRLNSSGAQVMPVSQWEEVTVRYIGGSSGGCGVAWGNYLTNPSIGMKQGSSQDSYEITGVKKVVIKEFEIQILDI